jgi:hypothetical protein
MKKWVLIDISRNDYPLAAWSARKVLGLYDTEEEAWQVSSDVWDCSGKQELRVVEVTV